LFPALEHYVHESFESGTDLLQAAKRVNRKLPQNSITNPGWRIAGLSTKTVCSQKSA